jgi:hypothetical protein
VFSTVHGYLIVLIIRLLTAFACLAQQVANNKTLHIIPTHPDTTGGLLPIGQVALFFSLFIFSSGIWLAGFTIQSFALAEHITPVLYLLWAVYLTLAPVLFFAPLLPLRKAMINAKREYLRRANDVYAKVEAEHLMDLEAGVFKPASLEGQAALGALIEEAGQMAVWPLDRTTLRRFLGAFISPLLPVVLNRISPAFGTALDAMMK